MGKGLLRPIMPEEIRTYEDDGVVWLRGILDVQWASQLAAAIDELIASPRGQAVDFTALGLAAKERKSAASACPPGEKRRRWDWCTQGCPYGSTDRVARVETGR